jgi:N-methylhydantoinase A/oxoprolinase/acetone carboxylase beta subunit/N-methylhydantoinase B/oxoprolinase/acetone carboxylase alpha subunit
MDGSQHGALGAARKFAMGNTTTSRPSLVAPWRLGIDVGGTFTDLVLTDSAGAGVVVKVLSVPEDPSRGVVASLERLARELGCSVREVLGKCALFVHGSTVATNRMIEGKGAKVGLLTTEGFRDVLEIRRGLREDQWNHRKPYAPVLVPRHLRKGVRGRMDKDGSEHAPLVLGDIDAALADFEGEGVEAVAVAFFNSFLDDRHEQASAAYIRSRRNDAWVTTSAGLTPMMGEYERTSTAVVNAALAPGIITYLRRLDQRLRELGLEKPMLLVQSNGGAISVEQVAPRPVNLLLSGPAAAVGALNYYRAAIDAAGTPVEDAGNLISMEIGGTSCDVLLMSRGEVAMKDDLMIAGYHVSTPAIDIHTIGAGGGTIAGVDSAGMLFVGPEGAGANPGPACYGLGGTEPAVTDAQLVLGRLKAGTYAGSGLTLDLEKARDAIDTRVARPLGLTVEEAAAGIIRVLEQNLLQAVEYISIERGYAPRRFTLVAAGGAGPMHGASVARGLGCLRLYVPRDAGALCAIGMLHADVRQDFQRFLKGRLDEIAPDRIDAEIARLIEQATAAMRVEGFQSEDVALERAIDLHYRGQLWSVRVPLAAGPFDAAEARRSFEAEYQRLYGHVQSDGGIVAASLRVAARAKTGTPRARSADAGNMLVEPARALTRNVWHDGHGWIDTAVWEGASLHPGARITGPAVIEERTTTVLLGPCDRLVVDATGNFMIEVGSQDGDKRGALWPSEVLASRTSAPAGRQVRDPVILALMQNRLDQISRHMGWVMTRTARSPIFSQSHDFSCYVTDAAGTLVANADGIPIHTGGGGFAVRALLRDFAGRIKPKDVFILSDPYVAGGNHLPDWVIARPIFVGPEGEGQLAGFCCNRAHQSDIGGGLAGTYNPEATEIWHEGIRLPVMKLIDRGELRDDLWKLLLINSRTAELLDGDLRAMLGSTEVGAQRVTALVEELGLTSYFEHLAGVLDHADARMRSAVLALPDGTYLGEDITDNDCFEKRNVAIRVAMTVQGDALTLDFSGSDPQIRGFKNSSLANTYSAAYMALSSFFETSIPRNEGTYRCVTIIAPEGSIVNARPPAPMTMNTVFVAHEICHAIWKALAKAAPDRACAGWAKTTHGHITAQNPDGSSWVMYQWHAMGTPGATAERDGFPQMGHLISLGGLDLPNLEFHEQLFPVRYRRWELRADAAGPGLKRGGTGVRYECDVLVPCTWSFRAEGLDTPSGFGIEGGGDGAVGLQTIRPSGGEPFVPPKYGVRRLPPATIVADTPGGGGWGDPFARAPGLVLRDVRDGVLTRAAAERDYGVVLAADRLAVDEARTRALRNARRMH